MRGVKTDSLLHLETSALIAIALSLIFPWAIAGGITLLVGIGKELWDKEHDGVASWRDIAYDIGGIAVGLFLAWI